MTRSHHRVDVNGIEMHYVHEGDGEGFPLVLLHGWPEFWRTWRKNMPVLAEEYDVVAPDLRGFGDTEKPDLPADEGYTTRDHAADLLGLADHLGFEEFGIVTHDLGAYVAQRFARDNPDRLRGIFFFDCPYPGIGDRWLDADRLDEIWYQSFHQQEMAADLVGSSREAVELYIGHFLEHWAADEHAFDPEDREAWVDNFAKPGNLPGGFNWYIAANEGRLRLMREGAPDLPTIDVPVRVLWGEADPVLDSAWADRLEEYFSDVEFDEHEGAGHFAHYEDPERANREIATFFERLA